VPDQVRKECGATKAPAEFATIHAGLSLGKATSAREVHQPILHANYHSDPLQALLPQTGTEPVRLFLPRCTGQKRTLLDLLPPLHGKCHAGSMGVIHYRS